MHANDNSIMNIGQYINELQKSISGNTGLEQYFETNHLSINPSKAHYILFQMKQYRQERELKILMKNREIVNIKSTNLLQVIFGNNLNWEVHIERTYSRINHTL
jgi:hypothetical protein